MRRDYDEYTARGVTFRFYQQRGTEVLHITARHGTLPVDAMDTYFDGTPVWNEEFRRYETRTGHHTLYWAWLYETTRTVVIITCVAHAPEEE